MDDDCKKCSEDECDETITIESPLSKSQKPTAFKNIVKRIQLAARFSNNIHQNDEENDCYHEDIKLNSYLNRSIRRGLSKQLSNQSFNSRGEPLDGLSKYTFNKGEIDFSNEKCNNKPFVIIEPTVSSSDIGYILKDIWELEPPKIITYVISSKSHKSKWTNRKQIRQFQEGMVKAAMSTNMWILTNGLNCGATAYICNAIEKETRQHKLKNFRKINKYPLLFGVSQETDLVYGSALKVIDQSQKNVACVKNIGFVTNDKYELNPHHSNFIILRDDQNEERCKNFMLKFIDMLLREKQFFQDPNKVSAKAMEIPLVTLLVEGGVDNCKMVLELIRKQLPVVVLKGSGAMSDIIGFAFNRIWAAFPNASVWDADYIEDYIKPLLSKKILHQFNELINNHMARNVIRDEIVECVRLSIQEGRQYLFILDMHNPTTCNLNNLSEHLLNALLKSKQSITSSTQEQILKDFDLIMDWNCANVAKNELFNQCAFNMTDLFKSKFTHVLTRENREEFVEIFLYNGFQLHKFLTPSRLSRLFRFIHDDDFFHTVCWETALGQSSNARQGKFFIESDLNWLIEFCTGLQNFVKTEDLHLNSLGMYTRNSLSAERKALTLLAIWAVMQNRYRLVEVLWKYSDHPVHLALIISMFFERLSWHVLDTNLKNELKNRSKQFASFANGVLDKCYNDNISLAYNVLREANKDWNYMTAVDIAASAQLKKFLAHPCCQKWLTSTFQGKIRIREITWGVFTIPVPIKILLCSLLIFPMYVWVRFKNDSSEDGSDGEPIELEEELDVYEEIFNAHMPCRRQNSTKQMTVATIPIEEDPKSTTICYTNQGFEDVDLKSRKQSHGKHSISHREVFVKKQPPLWKMIWMMWDSPITKFYTSQLFYIIFLVLISITTIYPSCGNIHYDSVVCLWALLIAISYIRHTYIMVIKYSSIAFYWKVIEIILILTFACLVAVTRVFGHYIYDLYVQKIILSVALLYFYYRMISIYLPISPTLGPLLYRFHLMITVDFVNYMRITLVILISNSIVIYALTFPYNRISQSSIKHILHHGVLSLFNGPPEDTIYVNTKISDREELCPRWRDSYRNHNVSVEEDPEFLGYSREENLMVYFFVFQYFIILKLIAGPLLFSIFASTASKWVPEIDSIWKFQRYQLVIDFANRLPFPEPLSLFYYIYIIVRYMVALFRQSLDTNKHDNGDGKKENENKNQNMIPPDDCIYWKQLAAEYFDDEMKKLKDSNMIQEWEYIKEISEEIEYEKRVLREIRGKIGELEKNLESRNRPNESAPTKSGNDEFYLSRMSPYPGTQINRYPLPRKYTSWQIAYFAYEPPCYSQKVEEFPTQLVPYLDQDILKLKQDKLRSIHATTLRIPAYCWNGTEVAKGVLIDRRSWKQLNFDPSRTLMEYIGDCRRFVQYKLDEGFLPLNPSGRTGIGGKGALPRWGPNHYSILIVIQNPSNPATPGGGGGGEINSRLLLQCIGSHRQLIERFVNNEAEIYDSVAKFFDLPKTGSMEELESLLETRFKCKVQLALVQSGYQDDPHNTDHSWKEADVFFLQFTGGDGDDLSDYHFPDNSKWCDLHQSPSMQLPPMHDTLINRLTSN